MTKRERFIPTTIRRQLAELKLTQQTLANALDVSLLTANQLCNGHRRVTADMALRLGTAFNTSPAWWLKHQAQQDLDDTLSSPMDCLMRERVIRLPGVS